MAFNKREIKVDNAKAPVKSKDVIYDPMGQWKFPGQVTKIPGGDITMRDVPYPILGVDNLGNQQMMYPEMNYEFPGTSVTEYPQLDEMRRGGLPRKNRTTHKNMQSSINDLMRKNYDLFGPLGRHYYKPKLEEGGWLDEYQTGAQVPSPYYPIQTYNPSETTNQQYNITDPYSKPKPLTKEQKLKETMVQAQDKGIPVMRSDWRNEKQREADIIKANRIQSKIDNPLTVNIAPNLASYLTRFKGMSPEEAAYTDANLAGSLEFSSGILQDALVNEMTGSLGSKFLGKGLDKIDDQILKSKESGLLSKAHYLNPNKTFKPDPNNMYRGLGLEGFKDAQSSKVLRPKQDVTLKNFEDTSIKLSKDFDKTYYAPGEEFQILKNYDPSYIVSVPKTASDFSKRYGNKNWSWKTSEQIPIDKATFYKKDWWEGYTQVKKSGGWLEHL
jgi:hypothetical protein